MKVFLFSNMYPSSENPGYGVFVRNVSIGLEDYGIHTEYVSAIRGKGGTKYEKLKKYIVFYLSIIKTYFKKYDCLYVHYPTYSAPLLEVLHLLKRKPLVLNFHGEDLLYDESSRLQSFLGHSCERLAKRTSFIVVPSDYYKDIVQKRGLAKEENIVVSPSGGINETVFLYQGPKDIQEELHLGFVGRLEIDKGILEFIDACILLSKQICVKATIIGYGPLNEIVADKVNGYPFFNLKFGVPQVELPSYYRDFDLFCFPTKRKAESLGLVGLEAMACGTPVLGSDIGGIKSYVKHGINGYLLRLDNLVTDIVTYGKEYNSMKENQRMSLIKSAVETAQYYTGKIVFKELSIEFNQRIVCKH